ncbi:MAG: PorP/SprF family type IX secretion system membrane protein [Cyclobacteriaceae bacterium]|nr:PorP/SprF family type IX secretion system membrane protein [Cyclobacteriaceae bacterium]
MLSYTYRKTIFSMMMSFASLAGAQDLPLFSQKLTNSFMYNPSVAGNGLGSVTLSSRTYWNGTQDAPRTHFLSVHTPFDYQKMGVGLNLVSESIGAYNNLYTNAGYAYHLQLNEEMMLSMGLSAEYTFLSLSNNRSDPHDLDDPLLSQYETRHNLDFAAGVSFRYKFIKLGASSNRLATALNISGTNSLLTQYYTGFINLEFPITPVHKIEPTFAYRKLTKEADKWDAGLYYSFKDAIILGASYSAGGLIHATAGLRFKDRYLVGYSFEMFSAGQLQRQIGGTNEITLRMDFRDDSYYRNTRNSQQVLEKSIAFKRKTLSTSKFKPRPTSASSSRFQKKLKRNYIKNPNYRVESSDKLDTKKRNTNVEKQNTNVQKSKPTTKKVTKTSKSKARSVSRPPVKRKKSYSSKGRKRR